MSTFKRILAEKKGIDYSKKGPSNVTPSKTISSKKLGTKKSKKGSPRGSGRGFGPSKDDAARYAGKPDKEQLAKVADDLRNKTTNPTVKKAASNILSGGAADSTDQLVGGKTAKSGTGGTYRGTKRPAEIGASGVKSNAYADWQREAVRARKQLKSTGTKFFGKPSGVDAQGKPTYAPPKETPKGETGRRAQRQTSPRSYASVKADLEAETKIKKLKVKPKAPATPAAQVRGREAMMAAQRNRAAKPAATPAVKAPTKATVAPKIELPKTPKSKVTGGTPRATDRVGSTSAPTKPTLTAAQQKKVTQRILKSAKPQLGKRLQTKTVPNLAGKVTTQASKVKPKVTAGGVLGRGLGALGAGLEGIEGYQSAKKAGAGETRSWLRGAARAAGGLLGATAGGLAGGGFGSFALGTAGYMAGSNLADKAFTSLAGATKGQKDWMKKANLASQKGTAVDKVKYRKGNKAVIYDPRVGKERIGTLDPTSGKFKAANLATSKAYTANNPFERLGRQFSRSNEGSGLFGLNIVKGGALADMAKKYYADKDEKARAQRVSDFKKAASAK